MPQTAAAPVDDDVDLWDEPITHRTAALTGWGRILLEALDQLDRPHRPPEEFQTLGPERTTP